MERVNPVKAWRVNAGLSQDELADRAAMSKRGIQFLEDGLFRIPSTPVQRVLCRTSSERIALVREYEEWIRVHRILSLPILETAIKHWTDGEWLSFRDNVAPSKIKFCKAFCMNQGVVHTFESRKRERLSPYMERAMLIDTGLSRELKEEFEEKLRNG